jgi:hypothetical protein
LIFCRTKQRAERLAQTLEEDGFKALPIHKGLTVTQRRNAIQMFRDGEVQVSSSAPRALFLLFLEQPLMALRAALVQHRSDGQRNRHSRSAVRGQL